MSELLRDSRYFQQVELMLQCLPAASEESCFALKGGTAINMFVQDLPRLSVDIDLTFLPQLERQEAVQKISEALNRISERIVKALPKAYIQKSLSPEDNEIVRKLIVHHQNQRIKIEPNEVFRGSIFPPEMKTLCPKAENLFEMSVEMPVLSAADLYGGKLCAALDRQHPRDIFDMKLLLENEGITNDIRRAFVVYLAGHKRPMNELIDPVRKDIYSLHQNEFSGMTIEPVTYEDLLNIREKYIEVIQSELTKEEKYFLISIKTSAPDWELIGIPGIEDLVAIQWKLINIKRMNKAQREKALSKLKQKLEIDS